VLNGHNTVFARSGPLYATGVSLCPPESSTQTTSRSLQLFLQKSLGDRPTDRPTDHATRSVTIGGAHSGEANVCLIYYYAEATNTDKKTNRYAIVKIRKNLHNTQNFYNYTAQSTNVFQTQRFTWPTDTSRQ